MNVHFDGYIPEDDYACVTIETGDTATCIAFTNDERDAVAEFVPLGWRCPVCGRGLAPDVKECSCVFSGKKRNSPPPRKVLGPDCTGIIA